MNKKHVGTIVAGIMASTLLCSITPANVNAMEIVNGEIIISPEEFVANYFFTDVNRDNYGIILYGKQIYDQLPYETRFQIEFIVAESTGGIGYGVYVDAANTIDEQVQAEQAALYQAQLEEVARIQAEQAALMEAQAQQEAQVQQEIQPEVVEEQAQPETPEEIPADIAATEEEDLIGPPVELKPEETPKEESTVEETAPEEVVEEMAPEMVEPEQEVPQEGPAPEESEEEISVENEISEEVSIDAALFSVDPLNEVEKVQPIKDEPKIAILEMDEEKLVPEVLTVSEPDEEVEERVNSSISAQSFIDLFCSYEGSIITVVNATNCQTILNGYNSWQSLSIQEKNEVNNLLAKAGVRSYTTMYNVAQSVNGTPITPVISQKGVNTGVSTFASFYSALCAASLAMLAFLFRKKSN